MNLGMGRERDSGAAVRMKTRKESTDGDNGMGCDRNDGVTE